MGTFTGEGVEELRADFAGVLLTASDAGYDEVRRIHNGLVDKRPALIARCSTANDVAAAVRLGRESGSEISVRGGGHNVAGKAVTDGGVMIDLSLIKNTRVDPEAGTITAGGGVTWGELNEAAHVQGLATTGGVISTTGIAGLTLGGGVGWLMGKYGMAVDNLISAEVVLASGEVDTANERSQPDLFWAIRGGGGNFGVVTRSDTARRRCFCPCSTSASPPKTPTRCSPTWHATHTATDDRKTDPAAAAVMDFSPWAG